MRPSFLLLAVLALSSTHSAYSLACSPDDVVDRCGELTCDLALKEETLDCYKRHMCCDEWKKLTDSLNCDDEVPVCEYEGDMTVTNVDVDVCPDFEKAWNDLPDEGCDLSPPADETAYEAFCTQCTAANEKFRTMMKTFSDVKALSMCEFMVGDNTVNAKEAMETTHRTFAGICVKVDDLYCYGEVEELMRKMDAAMAADELPVNSGGASGTRPEGGEDVDWNDTPPEVEGPDDASASQEAEDLPTRRMLLDTEEGVPEVAPMSPPHGITKDEMCANPCSVRAVAHLINSPRPFRGMSVSSPPNQGIAVGEPHPDIPDEVKVDAAGEGATEEGATEEGTTDPDGTRRMVASEEGSVEDQSVAQIEATCAMSAVEYAEWLENLPRGEPEMGGPVNGNEEGAYDDVLEDGKQTMAGDGGEDSEDEDANEEASEAVVLSVTATMQMSKAAFDDAKQAVYKEAVLAASGADSVEIVRVDEIDSARRRMLLAAGIEVETKLELPSDTDVATLSAADMTASINAELEQLDASDLAVTVTAMKEETEVDDKKDDTAAASPVLGAPPLVAALLLALSALLV
mmetsp:Transcript_24725/g.50151  ORF Transcript_24725/g.50151 Transcript_24725/m.50151 type:complete len:573 (+) Transcript_24725:66-1784(+)